MAYDFTGKIAFVTGGANGIGFAIVKEFLRNGVQAVAIVDINAEKGAEAVQELNQEFGLNRVIFIKTDVTKIDQLQDAFKKTIDTWNTIDIVINNAGFARDEQWELEISVNCNAVVQGTLLGLQYMGKDKGGKGGTVVNISSRAGVESVPFMPVYTGTKHFVVGFSRALGDPYHYNRTGVRILTMCPGTTNTNILNEAIQFPLSICPAAGKEILGMIGASLKQSTEIVAQGVLTIIREGDSGGVWLARNGKPPRKLQLPTESDLKNH